MSQSRQRLEKSVMQFDSPVARVGDVLGTCGGHRGATVITLVVSSGSCPTTQ